MTSAKSSFVTGEPREWLEEGVRIILGRWTALNLAVENQWGGPRSTEKAEDICEDVIYWFEVTKDRCPYALEEQLLTALLEDFNAQIEDGSGKLVSEDLVRLFEECKSGQQMFIETLRRSTKSGAHQSQKAGGEQACSSGEEESSDDGSDMEEDANAQHTAQGTSKSQEVQKGPIIDEDGFTLVQRGRRR